MADTLAFAYLQVNPAVRSDRLGVSEMRLHMRPYHHDVAVLTVQGVDDTDATRWTTGTPLILTYGRPGTNQSQGTWYGYVLGIDRHWDQTQRLSIPLRLTRITAIGASYWMKEDLTTVYRSMTTAQIAQAVASAHYLDTDIPPTPYVWPMKVSSGVTEWSFLSQLAKDSGLTFYCHGTQLRMYDPLTPLLRSDTVVPYFYEKDLGKKALATVLEFKSDVTEMSADPGRRKRTRVVNGIDAVTGQPIYASDSPTGALGQRSLEPHFTETITDLVALSQLAANALLPARSTANRFYIRATAKLSGDPRITQESPVVIEGLGNRDSGLWQVIEAEHHFKRNWFSTDVILGRDSDYDNGQRPGLPDGVARARLDSRANTVLASPPTVLVNNRWRAAWSSPVGSAA